MCGGRAAAAADQPGAALDAEGHAIGKARGLHVEARNTVNQARLAGIGLRDERQAAGIAQKPR